MNKKTPTSDKIKKYCTLPARSVKTKAVRQKNVPKAIEYAIKETLCKIGEEHAKG